jgi:hypothetical protein
MNKYALYSPLKHFVKKACAKGYSAFDLQEESTLESTTIFGVDSKLQERA